MQFVKQCCAIPIATLSHAWYLQWHWYWEVVVVCYTITAIYKIKENTEVKHTIRMSELSCTFYFWSAFQLEVNYASCSQLLAAALSNGSMHCLKCCKQCLLSTTYINSSIPLQLSLIFPWPLFSFSLGNFISFFFSFQSVVLFPPSPSFSFAHNTCILPKLSVPLQQLLLYL